MGIRERWLTGLGLCAALVVFGEAPAGARVEEGAPSLPSGLYFAPWSPRATSWMLTVAPEIGVQTGSETYEFHADIPNTLSLDVNVQSKLSYPVSGALGGGTVFFGLDALGFSGTFLTNIGNPWGTLLDQDFVSASDGTNSETVEFSHTNSPTTLRTFDVEGAVRYRLGKPAIGRTTALHLVAGFRFESSTYDAYGASGWQLDASDDKVYASIPGSPHALHYEVRYKQPFVGVGLNLGKSDAFLFSGEARLIASWSSHEDDHILRNKLAHADAFGGGAGIKLQPAFGLGGFSGLHFLAGLDAQLQVVGSFNGTLQQHYYADDPTLDGDQTNEPIPDSKFSFLSVRLRLLAFLAARF